MDELQRLFANDVDLTVGGSVTSAILNERGKYVAVVDLHRVSDDRLLESFLFDLIRSDLI